ncbi:MAG TPA: gliding motility-associated C-terminal domain-containing protein [Bacteroidia bacterium]|nr:gliding motility-associated C-terminal domain-containing protein [Bacteroidia bacterium]HNU34042.1 gliding motility-associated C-terminal domain-containing protein [Bacteroidia bacterium]
MKKLLLLFVLSLFIKCPNLQATHLMGGSLTYYNYGFDPVGRTATYAITLNIYRYCEPGSAQFQPQSFFICYDSSLASYPGKPLYQLVEIPLITSQIIEPPPIGVNCGFTASACVEKGIYEASVTLPVDTGFHIILITGARNGNIINISNPDSSGMTFYTYIPKASNFIFNNSPEINDIPVPYVCNADTVFFNCNAFDADGDSLVYSLVHPYGYASFQTDTSYITDSTGNITAIAFPLKKVKYNPGYNYLQPFGATGSAVIDSKTGLAKFLIPNQGFYVVAVEIKEYRNGIVISTVRRDIQLIVLACPPNQVPVLSASSVTSYNFTITEEDTLCLNLVFTDADADSISLNAIGSMFNSLSVNPPATLISNNGDSIASADFCWKPICGQARTAPYQFTISAFDDGCPPKFSEYIFSIKVDSFPGNLIPSVTIEQDPDSIICSGTEVKFTAYPVNEGLNPLYNWYLNGAKVGSNKKDYTNAALANADVVNLILTSSSKCAANPIAYSNDITMSVYQSPYANFSVSSLEQNILTPHFNFTNLSANASHFTWNYGDGITDTLFQSGHTYTQPGVNEVSLIAISLEGCTDTSVTIIEVTDVITLYIPNSFTPNNDGMNDRFTVSGNSLPVYDLKIFNRWGQIVFRGNNENSWDGKFNNKKATTGEYVYVVKFSQPGFNKTYKGTVALIR